VLCFYCGCHISGYGAVCTVLSISICCRVFKHYCCVYTSDIYPCFRLLIPSHACTPSTDQAPNHLRPFLTPIPLLSPSPHGFCNCSFLKNLKNPTQISPCSNNPTQKPACFNPSLPSTKFGNTVPGPSLSGAVALATIVATLPSTCAHTSVNTIWNLVSVCNNIIPNPTP